MSSPEPPSRERSMVSIGALGSKATVEGASNMPARSPWTRRRRAWARSRGGVADVVRTGRRAASSSRPGLLRAAAIVAEQRAPAARGGFGDDEVERDVEGGVLHRQQVPARARCGPGRASSSRRRLRISPAQSASLTMLGRRGPRPAGSTGRAARARARWMWPPNASGHRASIRPWGRTGRRPCSRGDERSGEGLGQRGLALPMTPASSDVRIGEALDPAVQGENGSKQNAASAWTSRPM